MSELLGRLDGIELHRLSDDEKGLLRMLLRNYLADTSSVVVANRAAAILDCLYGCRSVVIVKEAK